MCKKPTRCIQRLMIILGIMLCFSSCVQNHSIPENTLKQENTPEPESASPFYGAAADILLSDHARMITDIDGLMGRVTANTEDGQYLLAMKDDGSANITYIDYGSRSRIYLCSRPECEHRDENCTGWLSPDDCAGGAGLITNGESLYLMRLGAGTDIGHPEDIKSTSPSQVLRMDLDGANREVFLCLDAANCIVSSIVEDEGNWFFLQDSVASGEDEARVIRQLVKYDRTNRTVTPILTVNTHTYLSGVCKAGFILKTLQMQEDYSRLSTVYLYRTLTGETELVCQWNESNIIAQVYGQHLYMLDPQAAEFTKIDLDTKSREIVAENLPFHADDDILRRDIFNGHLCFRAIDHGQADAGNVHHYGIDLQNGALTEITLHYDAFNVTAPVLILAENSTDFLVKYNVEPVLIQSTQPDGTAYEFEAERSLIGLISKSDYWKNDPRYVPIDCDENFPVY